MLVVTEALFSQYWKRKKAERRSLKGKRRHWTWKPWLKETERQSQEKQKWQHPANSLTLFVFKGRSANKGSEQIYFKSSEGSQQSRKKYANRPIWNQSNIRTPLYISLIPCFHYTVSALNRTRKGHLGNEQRITMGYVYADGEERRVEAVIQIKDNSKEFSADYGNIAVIYLWHL